MPGSAHTDNTLGPAVEEFVPRHRPLLSAAVAFAAGIALSRWLVPGLWAATALAACCAACLVALRARLSDVARSGLVLLLVVAGGALTETAHTGAARRRADESLARRLDTGRTLCTVTGVVRGEITTAKISPLIETPDGEPSEVSSFRLRAHEIESNGVARATSGDVKIGFRGALDGVAHGDTVRVLGWIVPLDPADPASRYDTSSGYVARFSASGPAAIRLGAKNPGSFLRFIYAIKQTFRDQIDAYFDGDTATVLKATLLGDRERLGRRLGGSFNRSGTTHILAISGLHVGIVYAAAICLCRLLLIERWPRRVILLGAVLSYTVMVGFRPATVRAALMIVLLETGGALRYYRDSINSVAAAALVILAAAPHHLFEAGFQLTFIAVLGIILFSGDLRRLLWRPPDDLERLVEPEFQSRGRRIARAVGRAAAGGIGVCAAATLVVAPLQAYYFNIITPVSVVATAVLIPIVGAVIWVGFLFLALASFVPVLAGLTAHVLGLVVSVFVSVVELAGELPAGHVFVAPPPMGWVVVFYAALLVVAARRWIRLRGAAAAVAPALVVCAYLVWRMTVSPGADLAVTFVDVQHGTAALVTKGRQAVVYDCGSGTPFSTYDVGRGPVARELWKMGAKRIDVLLLSHTDADHVNGVLSLVERFPVGRVVVNRTFGDDETGAALIRAFERRGIPCAEAAQGDSMTVGDIGFEMLWPPPAASPWRINAVNDRSLVARVTSGDRSVLLTGDIEQAGMGGVLATRGDLRAEVLYVPHHGADEPVLPEFLRAVRPSIAIISGAPWESGGNIDGLLGDIRTYRTAERGTITLTATGTGWTAQTAK